MNMEKEKKKVFRRSTLKILNKEIKKMEKINKTKIAPQSFEEYGSNVIQRASYGLN